MATPNAFISNGTCYFGPGEEVNEWLPCGNAVLGDKTCCQRGDMCLSSRACYNGRYGITYLAGCSDPKYRDPSCPGKGAFSDQPWTGLVYCNGTSEQWVACEQSARPTTLTSADDCWCPQTSRTVAFTDSATLENVVQLPTASGGSVIWQPGYVPLPTQANTTPTTTVASTPAPSPTETSATTLPSNTSGSEETVGAGLAFSKKIGIGVGVGAGCAVLLCVLVFLFFARRKMQRQQPSEFDNTKTEGGHGYGNGPETPATTAISELEPTVAWPWSMRMELDGTPRSSTAGISEGFIAKGHDQNYHGSLGRTPSMGKQGKGKMPTSPIAELPG